MATIPPLTVRALTPADRDALRRLPERVSPRSAVTRFHGALTALSEPMLDRLLDLAPGRSEAVVALDAGISRFRGEILTENTAARDLMADLAPILREHFRGDHVIVVLDLLSADPG